MKNYVVVRFFAALMAVLMMFSLFACDNKAKNDESGEGSGGGSHESSAEDSSARETEGSKDTEGEVTFESDSSDVESDSSQPAGSDDSEGGSEGSENSESGSEGSESVTDGETDDPNKCTHYNVTKYGDRVAGCSKPGYSAHKKCNVCGAYLTLDMEEVSAEEILTPPDASKHIWQEVPQKLPTLTEEGCIAHKACAICGGAADMDGNPLDEIPTLPKLPEPPFELYFSAGRIASMHFSQPQNVKVTLSDDSSYVRYERIASFGDGVMMFIDAPKGAPTGRYLVIKYRTDHMTRGEVWANTTIQSHSSGKSNFGKVYITDENWHIEVIDLSLAIPDYVKADADGNYYILWSRIDFLNNNADTGYFDIGFIAYCSELSQLSGVLDEADREFCPHTEYSINKSCRQVCVLCGAEFGEEHTPDVVTTQKDGKTVYAYSCRVCGVDMGESEIAFGKNQPLLMITPDKLLTLAREQSFNIASALAMIEGNDAFVRLQSNPESNAEGFFSLIESGNKNVTGQYLLIKYRTNSPLPWQFYAGGEGTRNPGEGGDFYVSNTESHNMNAKVIADGQWHYFVVNLADLLGSKFQLGKEKHIATHLRWDVFDTATVDGRYVDVAYVAMSDSLSDLAEIEGFAKSCCDHCILSDEVLPYYDNDPDTFIAYMSKACLVCGDKGAKKQALDVVIWPYTLNGIDLEVTDPIYGVLDIYAETYDIKPNVDGEVVISLWSIINGQHDSAAYRILSSDGSIIKDWTTGGSGWVAPEDAADIAAAAIPYAPGVTAEQARRGEIRANLSGAEGQSVNLEIALVWGGAEEDSNDKYIPIMCIMGVQVNDCLHLNRKYDPEKGCALWCYDCNLLIGEVKHTLTHDKETCAVVCSACGTKVGRFEHDYQLDSATCTVKCTRCGKKNGQYQHNPVIDSESCETVCDICGFRFGEFNHSIAMDPESCELACEICGFGTGEFEHTYASGEGCIATCIVCGAVGDKYVHNFVPEKGSCAVNCANCGERSGKYAHNFSFTYVSGIGYCSFCEGCSTMRGEAQDFIIELPAETLGGYNASGILGEYRDGGFTRFEGNGEAFEAILNLINDENATVVTGQYLIIKYRTNVAEYAPDAEEEHNYNGIIEIFRSTVDVATSGSKAIRYQTVSDGEWHFCVIDLSAEGIFEPDESGKYAPTRLRIDIINTTQDTDRGEYSALPRDYYFDLGFIALCDGIDAIQAYINKEENFEDKAACAHSITHFDENCSVICFCGVTVSVELHEYQVNELCHKVCVRCGVENGEVVHSINDVFFDTETESGILRTYVRTCERCRAEELNEYSFSVKIGESAPNVVFTPAYIDLMATRQKNHNMGTQEIISENGETFVRFTSREGQDGEGVFMLIPNNSQVVAGRYMLIKYRTQYSGGWDFFTSTVTSGVISPTGGYGINVNTTARDLISDPMISDGEWHYMVIDLAAGLKGNFPPDENGEYVISHMRWDIWNVAPESVSTIDVAFVMLADDLAKFGAIDGHIDPESCDHRFRGNERLVYDDDVDTFTPKKSLDCMLCGSEKVEVSELKYRFHIDYFSGDEVVNGSIGRVWNAYENGFITDRDGCMNLEMGWAGIDFGFDAIAYRMTDSEGNVLGDWRNATVKMIYYPSAEQAVVDAVADAGVDGQHARRFKEVELNVSKYLFQTSSVNVEVALVVNGVPEESNDRYFTVITIVDLRDHISE